MARWRDDVTEKVVLGTSVGEVRQLSAMATVASSSGSASAAGGGSSSTGGAVTKNSCAFKVSENGCVEKRSCRDCLAAATNGEGLDCYLNALSGTCTAFSAVSTTALEATASVTNATERLQVLATKYEVFASSSQKYCKSTDSACTLCEAIADLPGYAPSTNQLKKMSSDRNICYGSNNCICVAKCEASSWISTAGARCSSSSTLPSYSTPSPASDNTRAKMLTFIGLFAALLVLFLVAIVIRKHRQLRLHREANGPYNTAGVVSDENRLELPGWSAWQRELRHHERRGDTAFVNLDKLRPSTPRRQPASDVSAASEASIVTLPLSSPPSSHHDAALLERLSV